MIRHGPPGHRRAYTLTIVALSLALLFGLWVYVIRTTSSLLRIETTRSQRQSRDQAAMNAMAQAVQLLQYGTPSDSQNPSSETFTYFVTVSTPNASPIPTSTGTGATSSSFSVVYALHDAATRTWVVTITPVAAGSVDLSRMLPTGIAPPIAWPLGAGS